jgi:hypothetical protein
VESVLAAVIISNLSTGLTIRLSDDRRQESSNQKSCGGFLRHCSIGI